jgi:hypothetical protein
MTVKTVGEMVHGHTFDAMATEWNNDSACQVGLSDATRCLRPYDEHALRPPMPRLVMDREIPMPIDRYGFYHHRSGCAVMCEVLGSCTCGALENNVSRIVWLMESQIGKAMEMASWVTEGRATETMPSTEFRIAYAGTEAPTDVTVNGRVIGRWTPVFETWPNDVQSNS